MTNGGAPGEGRDLPRWTRPFRVTFIDPDKIAHVIDVDPAAPLARREGQPGSLLAIALANGIEIDHACGGVCACSTCHVIIRQGSEGCPAATDAEEDQLDKAYGLTPQSRLACQCVPSGACDLVVELPRWNRNLVREAH